MKIEIWSDVMCPFCYIGKRKFETALKDFSEKEDIQIEWKSFQLSPDLVTDTEINVHEYLARHKGMSLSDATQMNRRVTEMARESGLEYNFDKTVVANSFNAHRFAHFAKNNGKQNEAEELLFKSYFTDGKNIDDYDTLVALGEEIGLDAKALRTALDDGSFADDVRKDIVEAQQIGVRGVPFFVLNRKYAVSGAQDVSVFAQTIEKAFEEWRAENPKINLEVIEGNSCTTDGNCD